MFRILRSRAEVRRVPVLQRFFRTGPGEYGEGDRFIGVTVPALRVLCRRFQGAALDEIDTLLHARVHEARLLALLLLVPAFRAADEARRRRI